jgi:uncharacterized protein
MKLSFLNRTAELRQIGKAIAAKEPHLIVIYGRRRCGKSRFLNQLSGGRLIYHLADLSEPALQRVNLANDINRYLPGFADVIFPTWESLFAAFFSRHAKNSNGIPATLILDELPHLVQLDSSLPSILQKLFDTGAFTAHVVLCGSSQRMMQGLVLDAAAPLYGRASEIVKIRPLAPGWIRTALNVKGVEAVKAYAVWGGVPRYWEAARSYPSVRKATAELIFNRDGLFHLEPHRLLMDDMRSDVQPHSLLSVIAGGCHRLSEIAGRLGKQAVSLSNPLGFLTELGYLKRDVPFGESLKSTKRTLYRLNDPFLLFWYRYVYPSLSLLEQDAVEPVLKHWDETFGYHLGEIWEELARLSVPHLKIGGIQWKEAYRWWGKDVDGTPKEIDVVAESMDGKKVLIGEAKWGQRTNLESAIARLKHITQNLPFTKKYGVVFALWAPGNTYKTVDSGHVFNADEILDALQ